MKIEWTDGQKELPKIGILNTGDIREVPEEIGLAYIKQGQAVEVKKEKKEMKGGE